MLTEHTLTNQHGLFIEPGLSNISLSRQLGIHHVTVAKVMSTLQKEHVLARSPAGIEVLDFDRLLAYAAGKKMLYQ